MAEATKRTLIPYVQALRLQQWTLSLAEGQRLISTIQADLERKRQKLIAVHEFAGIPLDRPVSVQLEAGPDEGGTITSASIAEFAEVGDAQVRRDLGEIGVTGYTINQGASVQLGITPLLANLRIDLTLHCVEMRGERNFDPPY